MHVPYRAVRLPPAVLALAVACSAAAAATAGAAPTPVHGGSPSEPAARFANPPAEARIHKIIHGWPDKPEAQDRLLAHLSKQGFGGIVCNVSFDQYLESEVKWTAFQRGVEAARAAGFALWLYDERGYPSGNAGGLTLRGHPEWEAQGLLVADAETDGGVVELNVPPGELFLAEAHPVAGGILDRRGGRDLTGNIHDGRLRWQAPPGRWRTLVVTRSRLYEGTHADGNLYSKIPYINLLMREPTERFVELTYGAYARRLGGDLGKIFMATFTDEPSLMSLFLKPMPYRPLPWAPELPAEFARRRGYPFDRSTVAALVADTGPEGARLRHDFWLTVGELVSENFFGRIQERCARLHIPSGGHLLAEEGLVGHTPLYGDFFRCLRRLDAPGIDCLTSLPPQVPWFIARLAASVAELEGRSLVMCETSDHSQRYRAPGDKRPVQNVGEEEIRGTCNRLLVAGVNDITSYYSFAGLSDEQVRRLNAWVGRCCTLLRGGNQVADIALLYPTESVWVRFTPSRHWAAEAAAASRIENCFRTAGDGLFDARRDFTYVDSRAIAEARVEGDALVHGALRWRVVVLPGADTLPWKAWEKLGDFVRSGGIVVALGALPRNSERDFPSKDVQRLAEELFGPEVAENTAAGRTHRQSSGGLGIYLPRGLEGLLPAVLDGLLEPDVAVDGNKVPLRAAHRRAEGSDLYFLINDSAQPWSGTVTVQGEGVGERWDPATGLREAVTGRRLSVELQPYGATFVRYKNAALPARIGRAALSSGATSGGGSLPTVAMQALPPTAPTEGHGEFVQAAQEADAAHGTQALPAWRFRAVLTREKVDTHLFAQFHYAPAHDFSSSDCLVIDTWVPEGQQSHGRILVILHEAGGGDFIAETGRPLGEPGWERSHLPLSRFQLAGWSKDGDGRLDLRRVSDVRVGWGGYFGEKDEVVEFSVASPKTGTLVRGR